MNALKSKVQQTKYNRAAGRCCLRSDSDRNITNMSIGHFSNIVLYVTYF